MLYHIIVVTHHCCYLGKQYKQNTCKASNCMCTLIFWFSIDKVTTYHKNVKGIIHGIIYGAYDA